MSTRSASSTASEQASNRGSWHDTGWPGVAALAIGIFVMVTIEELPIGVLTLISDDLDATRGSIGLGVTVTGLVAGVCGVSTSLVIGTLDRRLVLTGALLVTGVATALTALAPSVALYLAARFASGFGVGIFWALIAIVASKIVHPDRAALATTMAFTGASAAAILGVPFGTWLGNATSWRGAFLTMAAFCALTAVAIAWLVPSVHVTERFTADGYRRAWSIAPVRLALVVTAVLVVAQYSAYTYASPAMQEFAGVSVDGVAGMLLLMGLVSLVGNVGSAPVMRRHPMLALCLVAGGVAAGVLLLTLAPNHAAAVAATVVWGLFLGGMAVVLQHWVLTSAGEFAEPAAALDSGIFNASIASGAALGAGVLSVSSLRGVYVMSCGLSLVALALVLGYRRTSR